MTSADHIGPRASPECPTHPEAAILAYERAGYWRRETLDTPVRRWAASTPERCALVDGAQRWTYAELDRRVDRLAAGLRASGIERGARVLVQLPNGVGLVALCLALSRVGGCPVLAMPAHRASEIDALCRLAEPVAYVVPAPAAEFDYVALARQMRARHAALAHLWVDGIAETSDVLSLSALEEVRPEGHGSAEVSHRDVALFLLSGGTTGLPKLIPRTHADYAYNARASAEVAGLDQRTVYLAALPVAHNFALACPGVLGTLTVGGTVVLASTPSPDECFELVRNERVTITALVPPLVQLWLGAHDPEEHDLSSLRVVQVGGAPLDRALAAQLGEELGCALQQVFGMAEGLLCYTRLDDPEHARCTTQGTPLSPADELSIVDEQERDVAPGALGQLLVRGPYTLRGYYRAAAFNARAFTEDGFFRTGDLARLTPEGRIVIEGRIKDQINRGGEKIAAPELEEHVRAHPCVRDVAAIGMEDPVLGERTVIVLVASGEGPSLHSLRAFLHERGIAAYKLPDRVVCIDALPLTAVGKVDKKQLRALCERAEVDRTRAHASGARS